MTDDSRESPQEHLPVPLSRHEGGLMETDGLTRYLSEIRRYALLTREEEQTFATAFFERGDRVAGRRLVTGNLRLVVKIAMEFRRAWVNVMDLIQEGNIGLAEAVRRFDPTRGVRFSSFARYWIRALILQFILKNFRLVSFANTRAGRKLFFRLEKERARLMQATGEATPKQLAESLEVSEEDVVAATLMRQPSMSLTGQRVGDDDGRPLGEMIADESADVESAVIQNNLMATVDEKMKAFAAQLTDERERAIWYERLVAEEPAALAVIGDRFGVSRERIRQIETRLKKRLKDFLTEELGEGLILDVQVDD